MKKRMWLIISGLMLLTIIVYISCQSAGKNMSEKKNEAEKGNSDYNVEVYSDVITNEAEIDDNEINDIDEVKSSYEKKENKGKIKEDNQSEYGEDKDSRDSGNEKEPQSEKTSKETDESVKNDSSRKDVTEEVEEEKQEKTKEKEQRIEKVWVVDSPAITKEEPVYGEMYTIYWIKFWNEDHTLKEIWETRDKNEFVKKLDKIDNTPDELLPVPYNQITYGQEGKQDVIGYETIIVQEEKGHWE